MLKVPFFLFTLLFSAVIMYNQSDYIIVLERAEILSYNKNHVSLAKSSNFKYNRTHTGINFTLNILTAFEKDLNIEVQGYKFASNEYRLFPITFTVNYCSTVAKNDFGLQNLYSCGNFTRCPMKKGDFLICNWGPDYTKFPPHIPAGSYMLDLKIFYFSTVVAHAQGYGTVKRFEDFAPKIQERK